MMKKNYLKPQLVVIACDAEDMMAFSGGDGVVIGPDSRPVESQQKNLWGGDDNSIWE